MACGSATDLLSHTLRSAIAEIRCRADTRSMPVLVNLRLLAEEPAHLEGELPAAAYGTEYRDELIRFEDPLRYELDVERQPDGLLITGSMATTVSCECARCLKPFRLPVEIPDLTTLAPLQGEDAVPIDGDFADLTPLLREDIYLSLPANPLCRPDCRGLSQTASARDSHLEGSPSDGPSPWAALDKLKL
ncbi:MAG: hypothetical protein RLZ45_829 [Verrucomicrobiota bacterium]